MLVRHLAEGLGKALQYLPSGRARTFWHPSHCSTTGWQEPPLNPQPVFVMKAHSSPAFTVEQIMTHTSKFSVLLWHCPSGKSSANNNREFCAVKVFPPVFLLLRRATRCTGAESGVQRRLLHFCRLRYCTLIIFLGIWADRCVAAGGDLFLKLPAGAAKG